MKFGFLSGSLDEIEKAHQIGFDGIELKTDLFGNAAVADLDADRIASAKEVTAQHGIAVTALAHYGLTSDSLEPAAVATAYGRFFDAAERLGVRVVASMSGFHADRT